MASEKRLIDANAFLESIEGIDWYTIRVDGSATQGAPSEEVAWYKATDIYAAIENAPTVDAVEVVRGYNLKQETWGDDGFECSVCGYEDWDCMTCDPQHHNYCPNCGAKMDGAGNG